MLTNGGDFINTRLAGISTYTGNTGKSVTAYHHSGFLDFIGAKDNGSGGDKRSYKTCKPAVKSSPSTTFYMPDALHVA